MNFFIEEAQHCIINVEHSNNGNSALAAHGKKGRRVRGRKTEKSKSDLTYENCGGSRHTKDDCWSKGGRKEGQGPRQKKHKKQEKRPEESAAVAKIEKDELFAFTCTSDYVALIKTLELPKDKFGACVDSGTSSQYCPNCAQFQNY